MKIRRFLSVFFVTCLLCTLLTPQALALEDPDIRAKAAILVDADSGTVLYDKNIHQELPMASITKVMSALLVLEAVDRGQLRMDQGITATESAMKGMLAPKYREALLGHAIPEDKPHIDQTMTLGELNHSRSPLCWLAWAVLHTLLKRSSREGTPDLNLLFQYNMPVRALAQMTGGMVGQETVDGIVMEAKGFWIIGLLRALIGFGQNAVSNRKFRAALDAERGGPAV